MPWLARAPLLSPIALLASMTVVGCGDASVDDGGGAAHIGVIAELSGEPEVVIDDEGGTDVRVSVHLEHAGGPTAETFEVVSATLRLDLEPYADITLAIPADHPEFPGLADGEVLDLQLRGAIPDVHDDWGLCLDVTELEADTLRVSLDVHLRVTPGANDGEDDFLFESQAVHLACSHTG